MISMPACLACAMIAQCLSFAVVGSFCGPMFCSTTFVKTDMPIDFFITYTCRAARDVFG